MVQEKTLVLSREELIALNPESFQQKHVMNRQVAESNLLDIKDVFDKLKLDFWLWFGTFLGVYGTGELIFWDGDVDIAIFVSGITKLTRAEQLLGERGFKYNLGCLYRDGEHTDICIFYPEGAGADKWVCGPLEIDKADFLIPNAVEFLNQKWRIVSNPDRWLEYLYGKDWLKYPQGTYLPPDRRGRPLGGQSYRYEQQSFEVYGQTILIAYLEPGGPLSYIQKVGVE